MDNNGALWACGDFSSFGRITLIKFNDTGWVTYFINNRTRQWFSGITFDHENKLWAEVSDSQKEFYGVCCFDGLNWKWYEDKRLGNIKNIAVDKNNIKWYL